MERKGEKRKRDKGIYGADIDHREVEDGWKSGGLRERNFNKANTLQPFCEAAAC